ncbi:TIGR02757 family protein [Melioribacteraceae bacterium 4301-Me]|uniref:TIGR02757 family protein n=1 Tax=Pyranulibacter aquaticus TaxID=3163344 RepID=UPI003597363D
MKREPYIINLKQKLDYHYKYFDFSQISPDPLEFLHRYKNYHDIEISGIISSVFAYGNVKQIINTLEKIHSIMNYEPYKFVMNFHEKKNNNPFNGLKHRFYTSKDILILFSTLNKIYNSYGSLKYFFLLYYFEKGKNLKETISFFSQNFLKIISKENELSVGLKFMFPDPFKGSACKRMNLFLRWMVRKDELDFGLWHEIPKSKLVIPVDTHVAKICKKLKLTKKKVVSWEMAEEITDNLKKIDAKDPVKYDFAICHLGMRKLDFW